MGLRSQIGREGISTLMKSPELHIGVREEISGGGLAAGFPPEHDKPAKAGLSLNSGGGIRTRDLRVMSGFKVISYLRTCRAFVELDLVARG
jgi:hypothetical protein